jgi:outer membrane receptor protein involved in Fe transport
LSGRPKKDVRWRVSIAAEEARLTRLDAADASLSAPPDLLAQREALRLASAVEARIVGPWGVHAQAVAEANTEQAGNDGDQHSETWLTGRAGVHLHARRWQVWFNSTRAARPPALGERYGMSTSVHGNPNLRPESSLGLELAGRWSPKGTNSPIWMEGAAFVRWTDNAIVLARSSQGYATPVNQQGTRVAGIEWASGARLFGGIETEAGATLLDPRQTRPLLAGPEPLLPFQSRLTTHAVVRLRDRIDHRHLRTLIVETRFTWQSSRTADFAAIAILPAQSSFDIEIACLGLFGALDARLRVANLLDVPRFDFIGYPLPGRSIHASLEVPW